MSGDKWICDSCECFVSNSGDFESKIAWHEYACQRRERRDWQEIRVETGTFAIQFRSNNLHLEIDSFIYLLRAA